MAGKVAAIAALLVALAAAPAWADGQLAIQSTPSGATVTLDGSFAGSTPVLLDAPAGRYHIRVSMPGRPAQAFVATVRDGLTSRRMVRLVAARPASGELVVRSQPAGATVVLDGRVVGTAPLRLQDLAPGRHRVRAVMAGRVATASSISIHPGLTATVGLDLAPVPAQAPAVRVAEAPKPKPAPPIERAPAPAPRHVTPPAPAPARRAPVEAAPPAAAPPAVVAPPAAAPAPFVMAPQAGPAATPAPDMRPWLFWSLMALLLAWVARQLVRASSVVEEPRRWHPARGPLGIVAWPGPGAPSGAAFAAVAAMERGHWRVGLDALWKAIESEPGLAWHYYHIGLALDRLKRPLEAEGAYRTAAQLDPTWDAPAYNMAVLLAEAGQPAQALIAYRRLLDAHPTHVDGLYNLGHALVALGMPAQAIARWKAARRLARRDVALRENLARLQRETRRGFRPRLPRAPRLAG